MSLMTIPNFGGLFTGEGVVADAESVMVGTVSLFWFLSLPQDATIAMIENQKKKFVILFTIHAAF